MPPKSQRPLMIDRLYTELASVAHDALDYLVLVAHGNDECEERRDSIIDNIAEMLSCFYCKDYEFVDGEVIWIDDENTGVDRTAIRSTAEGSTT